MQVMAANTCKGMAGRSLLGVLLLFLALAAPATAAVDPLAQPTVSGLKTTPRFPVVGGTFTASFDVYSFGYSSPAVELQVSLNHVGHDFLAAWRAGRPRDRLKRRRCKQAALGLSSLISRRGLEAAHMRASTFVLSCGCRPAVSEVTWYKSCAYVLFTCARSSKILPSFTHHQRNHPPLPRCSAAGACARAKLWADQPVLQNCSGPSGDIKARVPSVKAFTSKSVAIKKVKAPQAAGPHALRVLIDSKCELYYNEDGTGRRYQVNAEKGGFRWVGVLVFEAPFHHLLPRA
jgi:hypothetical protein